MIEPKPTVIDEAHHFGPSHEPYLRAQELMRKYPLKIVGLAHSVPVDEPWFITTPQEGSPGHMQMHLLKARSQKPHDFVFNFDGWQAAMPLVVLDDYDYVAKQEPDFVFPEVKIGDLTIAGKPLRLFFYAATSPLQMKNRLPFRVKKLFFALVATVQTQKGM